jgi:hypothetical protein
VEIGVAETVACYSFPRHTGDASGSTIRSSAFCARSAGVVGAFTDGPSVLNFAAARLRYIAGSE